MEKLLINARYLDRPGTGVDRVAAELFTALKAHPEFDRRFHVSELRAPQFARATGLRSQIGKFLWEQFTLMRTDPASVLISPCNMGPALRSQHIVFMHDAQVHRAPEAYGRFFRMYYKTLQPIIGRNALRIITPSEFSKSDLIRFKVAPRHKIKVIPNGADHILNIRPDRAILNRHNLTPKKFFLAIGSLAPHKNLEMLLRAVQARVSDDTVLVIAGGGDRKVFAPLGVNPSQAIRMVGRVSDAELRALYDNATALLFPSTSEGFGLPPAEAMMCGCPVVSTNAAAVPEVCGSATISLDPLDQDGWTGAMEALATKNCLRQSLIKKGHRQVAQFTWTSAAKKMMTLLKNCSSDNRSKTNRRGIQQVFQSSGQSRMR